MRPRLALQASGNTFSPWTNLTLSPLDFKEGVIVDLSNYVDESKRFRKTIEEIEKIRESRLSADESQQDSKHGQRGFSRDGHTVRGLTDILEKSEAATRLWRRRSPPSTTWLTLTVPWRRRN